MKKTETRKCTSTGKATILCLKAIAFIVLVCIAVLFLTLQENHTEQPELRTGTVESAKEPAQPNTPGNTADCSILIGDAYVLTEAAAIKEPSFQSDEYRIVRPEERVTILSHDGSFAKVSLDQGEYYLPSRVLMPVSYQQLLTNRPGAEVRVLYQNQDVWAGPLSNGRALADRTNQAIRGIAIDLTNCDSGGTILYQAHEVGGGWLKEAENGIEAVSQQSSLNAVKVRLEGPCSDTCNVYTKVYQNNRWSEWVPDGTAAGDETGTSIIGICIEIRKKSEGAPTSQLRNADLGKKMIALTFDDSPSDRETDLLLDTLEQHDVRATFFVIGQEVLERRAGSLLRAIAGGSEIGIHTYGHENLTQIQSEEVISTCAKCSWMIESVLNCRPVVMRAPGGNCNKEALNALRTLDLPNILWSVDSQDWKNKTSEQIAGTILKEVENGSIILVHDTKDSTVEAIKTVVPELIERGYQFMTVTELFAYNGGLCSGKQYSAVGEADDPESEEAGFADMTIYDQDAVTVVFCGIDFDNSENVITLNISCNNSLEEIRKFRISGVEVNGEHYTPVEPLGALDPCSSTVYEFCISNVPGIQYGEIRSIRFAVEISDDKNERLAASKTVSIALEPEQETFSATAEAQPAPV